MLPSKRIRDGSSRPEFRVTYSVTVTTLRFGMVRILKGPGTMLQDSGRKRGIGNEVVLVWVVVMLGSWETFFFRQVPDAARQ